MRAIYIARHATYVLDSDGTLMCVAEKGPSEVPSTAPQLVLGGTYERHQLPRLAGAWVSFCNKLTSCMTAYGLFPTWPGGRVRMRRFANTFNCEVIL